MGGAEERIEKLAGELEELRRDAAGTNLLLGLGAALSEVKSVEQTIDFAVKLVPDALGGDRCFAMLVEPESGELRIAAHSGFDDGALARLQDAVAAGTLGLVDAAVDGGRVMMVEDPVAAGYVSEPLRRDFGAAVCIPLARWGEDVGMLCVTYPEPRAFATDDESLARAIGRQIGIALANARRFGLLGELRNIGILIGSKLRLPAVIEQIESGARSLLSARHARLYFLDHDGRLLVAANGEGSGPSRIDLDDGPWKALRDGEMVAVAEPQASLVAAPIMSDPESLLGAVVVFLGRDLPLGAEEEKALSVLAAQAGTAIETARRFEHQRRVAMTLQRGLLAHAIPSIDGFEVGTLYEAAGEDVEVGGDFYDVFEITKDTYALVVGDVSGKGAEAAAQTAMAKYMLRAFAMRNASPKSVMFHLNNALVEGLGEERFATLSYVACEPGAKTVSISLAGHPEPLLYRAADGSITPIGPAGGILGAFRDQQFEYETFQMTPGDALVIYTDGLIEARSGGDLYGGERLTESLALLAPARPPADELARQLFVDAQRFGSITDDTVILAVICRS